MTNRASAQARTVGADRFRCNLFFLGGGVGVGAWAACLPVISEYHQLSRGELGVVLLFFALGAIAMMVNVWRLAIRYSYGTLSLFGALTFGLALLCVPHVSGVVWLATAVFIAGAGFGTLDVSMNTSASGLERSAGRHLMSSFHAMFSFGNLAGAFAVGQILSHGGGLSVCLTVTGVGVVALALAAGIGASAPVEHAASRVERAPPGMLDRAQKAYIYLLGSIAFLALLAEGGLMDWSAIYIVSTFEEADSVGAYGFAIFATMMAMGRLFGDAISTRIGSTRLLFCCALVCAASVALLLAAGTVMLVFLALAICGLGVANVVPAIFASAGRSGGAAAGRAMSIVTTMGYAGLLLGPALLGFVAQLSSLVASFCLIGLAFLVIAAAVRRLREPGSGASPPA